MRTSRRRRWALGRISELVKTLPRRLRGLSRCGGRYLHELSGLLVLGVVLGTLGGCGFHLRAPSQLPADVSKVYLTTPYPVIADRLSVLLEDAGAKLMPSRKGADAILSVPAERFDRRVLSYDPKTGTPAEYELAYTLRFDFQRANGKVLVPSEAITLQRDYVYDVQQVLGSVDQQATLETEMRRDAVRQILRRIDAALGK